jgi:hypothetical protein
VPATHGEMRRGQHSKEADIWQQMQQRCFNPKCKSYPNYGGRGITVCERWLGDDGLINFIADMGRKPPGMSLDREDNDGPYSPENCRWATRQQQQRNRRANFYVTIDGETKCVTEWAEIKGIKVLTVFKRIRKFGWTPERAITEPILGSGRRPSKLITVGNRSLTAAEWSQETGVPVGAIRLRLRAGWEADKAVSIPSLRRKAA